jgi:FkbM family methyltransferase
MVYNNSKKKYNDIFSNYKELNHYNKAISDHSGKILFNSHYGVWESNGNYLSDYTGGSNCIEINPKKDNNNGVIFDIHQEYVDCIDINEVLLEIVNKNNLNDKKCIYIKCDIEGSEFTVLPKLLKSEYLNNIKQIHIEWHERFYEGSLEYNNICKLKQDIIQELSDNNIQYFEHH